jgi:hypothetical protein
VLKKAVAIQDAAGVGTARSETSPGGCSTRRDP